MSFSIRRLLLGASALIGLTTLGLGPVLKVEAAPDSDGWGGYRPIRRQGNGGGSTAHRKWRKRRSSGLR